MQQIMTGGASDALARIGAELAARYPTAASSGN